MSSGPRLSSWSKMRQELKSFLAPSLAGRIDYMLVRYRHAHDETSHAEIHVDGRPVTNFCDIKWDIAYCSGWNRETRTYAHRPGFDPENVDFRAYDFVNAAGWYLNAPIEESLMGRECEDKSNPRILTHNTSVLRQCLAVMDRRVGKRMLRRLEEQVADCPAVFRYFYALRCQAEGITMEVEVPESLIPDARPRA